jgi:hypothetical protein
MIVVPYVFSHDNIAEAMKQESSLYAERKLTEEGNSLFDELVFDEEYYRKFRELFFEAQAEVIDRYSPYMEHAVEGGYFDEEYLFQEGKTNMEEDFTFTLHMPPDYNQFYNKQVSIKTREFLIAYIMYRWLETKSVQEAMIYKNRADISLMDARAYLEKRVAARRTSGGNMF